LIYETLLAGKGLIALMHSLYAGFRLSKIIRVRYENGVLKPLEPLEMKEGEVMQVILKTSKESIARKLYGIAKKRRPELTENEFSEVIEEIENEDIHGH